MAIISKAMTICMVYCMKAIRSPTCMLPASTPWAPFHIISTVDVYKRQIVGIVVHPVDELHLRAVFFGGLHLGDGCAIGQTNDGFDPVLGGGEGHALGMVARRAGDNAMGFLLSLIHILKEEGTPLRMVLDSRRETSRVMPTPSRMTRVSPRAERKEEAKPPAVPTKNMVMMAIRVGTVSYTHLSAPNTPL